MAFKANFQPTNRGCVTRGAVSRQKKREIKITHVSQRRICDTSFFSLNFVSLWKADFALFRRIKTIIINSYYGALRARGYDV